MDRPRRAERIDRGIKARSESIYALSSLAEIGYLAAPRALLVGGLLALPLVLSPWPYWSRIALTACLVALIAMAFDFLANYAGLVCLGGAFFYGVGGYAAALANKDLGLPLPLSLLVGTVAGALFSTAAIAPCLRLRGIYFAVVTLMYPLLAVRAIEAADLFGGTEGFRGMDGFPSPLVEHYALAAAVLATVFALRRFAALPAGIVVQAVRDDDQAVRAAGISVAGTRTKALFLAALPACFAGAYYVHLYRSVGVSAFALDLSILPIAAVVVGGPRTLYGAILGSFVLVPLGELLRDFGSLRIVLYAVVLTAFVVMRSEGILPFAARKYQQLERWAEV